MLNRETSKEMAGDLNRSLGLLLEDKMMDDDEDKVIYVTQQTVFHFKVMMEKLPVN
jgi:hypothetical protein